jgi:hypothetical protein
MLLTSFGTFFETIVVFFFWGSSWHRWTLGFRVATPILHVVFSAAQLWGAYNFYKMWQHRKKLLRQKGIRSGMVHELDVAEHRQSGKSGAREEARPTLEA